MTARSAFPAIVILSEAALPLAQRLQAVIGGDVHGPGGEVAVAAVKPHLQALLMEGRPIIAIMAGGALIRCLAPVLQDKHEEPPVLSVAADGSVVVPLLGGHHGANRLATTLAAALGAQAAITTAGDIVHGVALDEPPAGWQLDDPRAAKPAMAALAGGASAAIIGDLPFLGDGTLPVAADGAITLEASDRAEAATGTERLVYRPRQLMVGIGCERHADPQEVCTLVRETLTSAGLSAGAVAGVFSIDVKCDEPAVHAAAAMLGVPSRFFDAVRLEAEAPRLENPSDIVFAEVGCHGVAEGAALAAAGTDGSLVVAKVKSARATCAIARAAAPVAPADLPGRKRGTLYVIGIGPGNEGWRSPEVSRMVRASTDLVGYSLYLDLLGPLAQGRVRHDFDLGREEDRVRHAMELAGEGRDVALVCSGDAGIYAMATLVFELFDKGGLSDQAQRIAVEVSPGISALQAAAARAGAPLGHDCCTISLSDLLTPWEDIKRRVKAAGEGDFVIAFYNPVSKKRRTQLAWARDELLRHRPADAPVILATNLGREGETVRVVPLGDLQVDDVDMLTVVVVGSSNTRVVRTGDGRDWVYTPRGYSAKVGTGIGEKS